MKKQFAVVGGDARQKAAGAYLAEKGFRVTGAESMDTADYILLPLSSKENEVDYAGLLGAAKPGAVAFAGRVTPQVMAAGQNAGVPVLDYFRRPELAQRNAVPTAEGCIALLMEHRPRTIHGSTVLTAGYGRIGRALAMRLKALGAQVIVAARRAEAQAEAEADGHRAIPMERLAQAAAEADCAVNTIPAMVFAENVLAAMGRGALLIDLASRPGGTDFAAAEKLGVTAIHALGLPAKCAPATAGELVGQTVLAMLAEKGENKA